MLHGQYALRSNDADIDQLNTHQWLMCAGPKAETEEFIMADIMFIMAENVCKELSSKYNKNGTDPRSRLCEDKVATLTI